MAGILSQRTKTFIAVGAGLVLCLAIIAGVGFYTKFTVHGIFELNQERKAEGYYLTEFEWEMLGAAYFLDHCEFVRAFGLLRSIHHKLDTGDGLVRIPTFSSPEDELEFYLDRQNPATGAFMSDASLPLFTFIGPTANMLDFIEELSVRADKPFLLKYPLKFLDAIATPERLVAMLDDVSRVGPIGSRFKPAFVCVAELGGLMRSCERLGVYSFSPQWKKALYDWFYANQDPATGLWGARSRSDGSLVNGGSLTESERVVKLFVDGQGNQLYPEYPLRHVDAIIDSAIDKLVIPMPHDLDELHEWLLARDHGSRFVFRYLWQHASQESHDAVRGLMVDFIRLRFNRYFVKRDGAFSLYPDAASADLDGTGEAIGMYRYLGVMDETVQQRLWGKYEDVVQRLGTVTATRVTDKALRLVAGYPGVNSVRAYAAVPEGQFLNGVRLVYLPVGKGVMDAAAVLPGVRAWLDATPQVMGNWVPKVSIENDLGGVGTTPVPTYEKPPLAELDGLLKKDGLVALVGFDELQAPRCMLVVKGR